MEKKKRQNKLNLTPRTRNSSLTGDISENMVFDLLGLFDSVSSVRRDRYGSKFDIFYELKGEDFTRGLQVKTITQIRADTYSVNALNKYIQGMLVVGVNRSRFGFVHVITDSDKDTRTQILLSLTRREKSVYEKEILMWPDFLVELEKSLTKGIIVTPEIFRNSVSSSQYKEYESIERFKECCEKYGLNVELVYDVSSPTDLIVNGFKVQMKYCSQSANRIERRKSGDDNSHRIALRRSGLVKYIQGDNDFYIIELGCCHADFLWIPEYLLVEKGYISNGPLEKARHIHIFPHNYVEKQKLITVERTTRIKGNWSSNKRYWISTEKGCLGSTNDVAIHIENLLIEEWIDKS